MEEYVNYDSVVINLDPTENAQTDVRVATYEQAFLGEEFSNLKGKGRARRKKRKLERISNKREVRTERRKLKSDRGEERIARRKTRKAGRQEIRGEQQEARMSRRNKRAEAKENRKGEDEETEDEETTTPEQGAEDSTDGSSTDSSSNDTQDDQGSNDSSSSENEDQDSEDGYEDSEDGYEEADESFDGDSSNFSSEVTGRPSVPSAIQTICYKIEMNNEMISQLLQTKKMLEEKGRDTAKINNALATKHDIVQNLEGSLENFAGADGKRNSRNSKVVKIAKRKARAKRIETLPIPPVVLYNLLKKGVSKDKIKQWWETKGRKQHVAKNNFEGGSDDFGQTTATDYTDYSEYGLPAYDYDQPQPQVVDLDNSNFEPQMNFSGDGGSNNTYWRSIVVGGLMAFGVIYLIRKYKLMK